MKKRVFTLLLALCMIVSLLPFGAAAADVVDSGKFGADGDNLSWTLDSDGLLTISGTGEMEDYNDSRDSPFYKNDEIKAVVIEPGVTSIGSYTFTCCYSLTSVVIPDSVTSIGMRAFYLCISLTNIAIPDSVSIIRASAFRDCRSLENITIPNGVTSIEDSTFSGCSSLTSVTIPDSVTNIESYAFNDCSSLTSITIPDSVEIIRDQAFMNCSSLTSIDLPDSVYLLGVNVFSGCSALKSVTLSERVSAILPGAFQNCTSLTSITIPDKVYMIGKNAFAGCTSLTTVEGLSAVLEDGAFEGCTKLGPRVQVKRLSKNALKDCASLEEVVACYVGTIEAYALSGCTSLTTLRLSDSLNEVATNAFRGSDNLKDVYFCGTEDEWNAVKIRETGNDPLKNATIHFNSHILTKTDALEPACPNWGYEAYWTCELCGKMFSDAEGTHPISDREWIMPNDHSWGEWSVTTPPTETAEGVETRICSVCGFSETHSIPKLTPKPDDTKPSPKPISNPFTDVKSGEYYFDPVLWAVNHDPQITKGTSDTTFSPADTCTRGQVVTFLWRAMGCDEPTTTNNPFTDVKESDYFYKAVLWAVEKGITNGTSATTFSPKDPCTRAHLVTFLWRAENKPDAGSSNPFSDVPAGQYYSDAVLWAVSKEVTNGTSATTFSPNDPCTRGQIVTFLYRDMK